MFADEKRDDAVKLNPDPAVTSVELLPERTNDEDEIEATLVDLAENVPAEFTATLPVLFRARSLELLSSKLALPINPVFAPLILMLLPVTATVPLEVIRAEVVPVIDAESEADILISGADAVILT